MIHETSGEGVFVYLYDRDEDCDCFADLWFETVSDAQEEMKSAYDPVSWIEIGDPPPGCKHDRIAATPPPGG